MTYQDLEEVRQPGTGSCFAIIVIVLMDDAVRLTPPCVDDGMCGSCDSTVGKQILDDGPHLRHNESSRIRHVLAMEIEGIHLRRICDGTCSSDKCTLSVKDRLSFH